MDGINRKPMQDVLVPQNEIIRKPFFVPESRPTVPVLEESSRIEKNPFFEKGHMESVGLSHIPRKPSPRFLVWGLALLALLGGAFAVLNYFSSATIEVVPLTQSRHLENEFIATKEAVENGLAFDTATLSEEKTKEVSVSVEKTIQKKAFGKVKIFNSYSAESQRLIKNTRLETLDHKVFRINDSVVVPGTKVLDGKVIQGEVEAVVYADAPGKEYNIGGLIDFTIPGFKGDPRYTKFKAMTIPDSPIGGGFSGTIKVPTDEAINTERNALKEELKVALVEKIRGDLSSKNVSFFPGSMVIKFEEVPQDLSADRAASVTMRATISVFFFDTELLTRMIARTILKDYKEVPITLLNMSTLKFTPLDPIDEVVLTDLTQIRFRLEGEALFVGRIDQEKLITEIIGKNKKDFPAIITAQNNIKRANAVVRPMWQTAFPVEPAKISIKIITE